MIWAFLALLPPAATDDQTLEISRGTPLADGIGYWSVQEASLTSEKPNLNSAGSPILFGGPGKTILLQFGDLARVVRPGRKITDASLILTSPGVSPPAASRIAKVLVPWNEGPWTPLFSSPARPVKGNAEPAETAPRGSVTWRARLNGLEGWQSAGARGAKDTEAISGANSQTEGDRLVINGLGPALEAMRSRPYTNFGLALEFSTPVEFTGGYGSRTRPLLRLKTVEADVAAGLQVESVSSSQGTVTARIRNLGTSPQSGQAAWIMPSGEVTEIELPSLAPGASAEIGIKRTAAKPEPGLLPRPVTFAIPATPSAQTLYEESSAIPFSISPAAAIRFGPNLSALLTEQIRIWNEVVAPNSRYSFSPDGPANRVRLGTVQIEEAPGPGVRITNELSPPAVQKSIALFLGLIDHAGMQVAPAKWAFGDPNALFGSQDRFPGIMGGGDSRFEGGIPSRFPIPYEPAPAAEFLDLPAPTGLLSASDVALLASKTPKYPRAVILRAVSGLGNPLANQKLDLFPMENGTFAANPSGSVTTGPGGTVFLPMRSDGAPFPPLSPDGANGVIAVRAAAHGIIDVAYIKAWQLMEDAARGAEAVAIRDLRFDLPSAPVNQETNLAVNRVVSDSAASPTEILAAIVDDNAASGFELAATPGGWIEIDLGRDRTIGEITVLAEPMWGVFDLMAYATGQLPGDASPVGRERDFAWTKANRGRKDGTVTYRSGGVRARYLRFVNRGAVPGVLKEVRVYPVGG